MSIKDLNLEYPAENEFPYPFHDTGITVTAMTYTGNPWDLEGVSDEPFEVRGTLFIRPSPWGGLQCSILMKEGDETKAYAAGDQLDVDPATVKKVEEESSDD